MSFGAGFVTGFASTLAEGMLERQKEARDYFNKQVDYARTTGLQNRQKTKQVVEANLSVARQLEAVGVPREVIMAQVNQDPAGLDSFFKQAETIRAESGKNLSPEEWRAIYKVAGDFKAPDEDLSTFIARTYDPISTAMKSPSFEDDPEGSLVSSILGFDQMDKARRGLANTEIAEGLTAEQLIRYGDTQPQRVGGNATVVTDYTAIPERPKRGDEDGGLSNPQVLPVYNAINEDLVMRIGRLRASGGEIPPGAVEQLRQDALSDYTELYGGNVDPARLVPMIDLVLRNRGLLGGEDPLAAPESASTGPQEVLPNTGSPAPVSPPVASPTISGDDSPIDPEKEPSLRVLPSVVIDGRERSLTFVLDNGDGTSVWIDQDGEEFTLPNSAVRS